MAITGCRTSANNALKIVNRRLIFARKKLRTSNLKGTKSDIRKAKDGLEVALKELKKCK